MIYSGARDIGFWRVRATRRASRMRRQDLVATLHSGRRHDNRHYRPGFKEPFAGLQQRGGGARTVRKGRSATRHLGHPACPRGLASRCLHRARLRPCAGPALADGSAVAPGYRALRAMGRKIGAGRRCAGPAARHRRRLAARFRAAQQRHQGDARSLCARRQRLHRAGHMAGGIRHSRRQARGMGAVAFDRGDAPDRIPDGLGMVEAVARGGAADRRRGSRYRNCVSTMAATTCCAFRPAPRACAISRRSPT